MDDGGYKLTREDMIRVARILRWAEGLTREQFNNTDGGDIGRPADTESTVWPVVITATPPGGSTELSELYEGIVYYPDSAQDPPWQSYKCWVRPIPGGSLSVDDTGMGRLIGWRVADDTYFALPIYCITAPPIPGPAPAAPGTPTATPSSTQVQLAWTAPSGPSPTQYVIEYNAGSSIGSSPIQYVVSPPTSLSATIAGLTNATQYAFAVYAIDNGSASPLSATVLSTPVAAAESSVTIQPSGTQAVVNFNQPVNGFTSGANGFTLTGLTLGATTLTYASGNGTSAITFNISRTVYSSETGGVLGYTPGAIAAVSDGSALGSFSGASVTNSSTQTNISNTNGYGTAVTLPTNTSGKLVLFVTTPSPGSQSTPSGWTALDNTTMSANGQLQSFDITAAGQTGITLSTAGAWSAYSVVAVSTIDAHGDQSSVGSSSSCVAPGQTATGTVDMQLAAWGGAGTITFTTPGGFTCTSAIQGGGVSMATGYKQLSSSGSTGNATATLSSGEDNAGDMVLLK